MQPPKSTAKPIAAHFNLQLYMRLTTGVAVIGLCVILWLLLSHIITRNILRLSQQNAVAVVAGLRDRLATAEWDILAASYSEEGGSDSPAARLQWLRTIQGVIETFNIQQVRIYDGAVCLLYSSKLSEVGACSPTDADVQRALTGETFSYVQRTRGWFRPGHYRLPVEAIVIYVPIHIDLLITQTPFHPRALELYLDIAPLQETLRQTSLAMLGVLLGTMSVFYAVQNALAGRAQRLITAQQVALETRNHELETLQQLKDDLTHMIVHDMKNPLTGIMGYLGLLLHSRQRGNLTAQQVQMLETANLSSQRLLDMTMDLLDITRMEAGKFELHREPVALPPVVDEALLPFLPAIAEMDKHLQVHLPADLPPLSADRDILRRILTNLISNAVKHTERAGHIAIEAQVEGDMARISVSDTGEGIPEAALASLFDKFCQVQAKRLGSRIDTGLGLTFCRMAVEAHGGHIHVASEIGVGSTFTITLPTAPPTNIPFTETGE